MGGHRRTPSYHAVTVRDGKKLGFQNKVFRFLKFLYKDQTQKYVSKAKAHGKHPIHGTPFSFPWITAYKTTSPLAAEILSLVWGTPADFNGFRVLAALLHGI